MKISKLFHWLYAFLMFLPIVLFIPNALYYGFNEHATNTETTTINYKYQSNEVNTLDDLVEGNIYYLSHFETNTANYGEMTIDFLSIGTVNMFDDNNVYLDEVYVNQYINNNGNKLRLYLTFYDDDTIEIYSYLTNDNSYVAVGNYQSSEDNAFVNFDNCIVSFPQLNGDDTISLLQSRDFLPQYTDYNIIESVEINTNDTISNKMYQAWQSTWSLPLLQWTHTSFVAQPFTYITGLFGVPSDSTLNYIFAYFVSISICWLVFDLLMYVPNLAHRWLDRSALE